MTRLLLALLMLWIFCAGAQAQKPCTQISTFQHTAPTGPVEVVPGIADQRIYPCGFMLTQKGNTLDFQMWAAPAGTCANGPNFGSTIVFSPQLSLPVDVQLINRLESVGPVGSPGYSLCIQTFGAGALTGAIYWAQF
jgi:hypothetical protein